jgi:putative YhbY family RNA-binding protein
MKTPTPSERRALRARAHALDPVVIIGHHGLTAAVLKEIDSSLTAHELIKVRCADGDRAAREAALARICAELDAAPVQHLGKLLIVWRPRPDDAATAAAAGSNKPSTTRSSRRRTDGAPRAPGAKVPATGSAGRAGTKGKPAAGVGGKAAAAKRSPPGHAVATGAKAGRGGVRAKAKTEPDAHSRAPATGPAPASRRTGVGGGLPAGSRRRSSANAAPVAHTAPRPSAKAPAAQRDSRRTPAAPLAPSGAASRRRRRTT